MAQKATLHGHPYFYELTDREVELHSRKNHDYASGGHPLGNFNRVAAILSLYPGLELNSPLVIALTYMLKQLDAVLWGIAKGIKHKVEGLSERLFDIGVYSKICQCILFDARLHATRQGCNESACVLHKPKEENNETNRGQAIIRA